MFLIDTMVLSELRRRQRDPAVVAWIAQQRHDDCYLSVVSIGEIERGIARRRDADPAFADELAAWLDRVLRLHGERLLAVDLSIARRWGQLSAALEHGLTVVTRNVRHFTPTGVATFNPWSRP